MAAVTPVANVEALERAIQKSGLLSTDALAKVHEAATKASEPKQLARELVKNGTLTRWQAEQLLHGYHRLIVGKYKLLDQIAASPTGRIYLAEHVQIGRRHALKVLAKRLASNPQAVKRFLSAAQTACGLDHRNVSHCYDVNQDHERHSHYVVMEHVEGESLERLVERSGRLDPQMALNYAVQAADGLAHAHQNGVVHGDLKPANLILDSTGTIKILEMGQASSGAAFEAEGADEAVEMAALAAVIFQPPELRGDGETPTIACDVYSLGSVLTYLLTAKAAPDAATAAERLKEQAGVPPELVETCQRMMADQAADRPKTISHVADELVACSQQLAAAEIQAAALASEKASASGKGKTKKPPVAKPLDSSSAAPLIIPGVTHPVIDPAAPEPFAIKTKGRIGKKPMPQAAASASSEAHPEGPTSSAAHSTFTPLVLGAIGGGAFVVLGLLIAVVCLLIAVGRRAKTNDSQPPAAVSTDGQVAPLETAVEESNPVSPAAEQNPETNPTSATPNATVTTAVPDAEAAATPAQPEAAQPAVPEESETATLATPETPVAKANAKPEVTAQAKSPPATPASKAPVKFEPFKGLAKAVSLPSLSEPNGKVDAPPAAVKLGPCKLDDSTILEAKLAGGDTAVRGTKHRFELQPKSESKNAWDILVNGVGSPAAIAALGVEGGNLQFQWTEEASQQANVARQLCNCALQLTAGTAEHFLALRTATLGAPLVVDIDKPNCSVKWSLGELPPNKQIFVEVTRTEEIKRHRQEPKNPVNAGEAVTVWTGEKEEMASLGLTLATVANAREVSVHLQPQVKFDAALKSAPYKRKEMQALHHQTLQELPYVREQLEQAKKDRPSTNPQKAAIEKPLIEKRKIDLTVQLEKKDELLNQLIFVTQFSENYPGTAKVHFRVYSQVGDAKVELLRTEDPQPAKGK